MKIYSLFVFVCFCFLAHAQDSQHRISVGFKTGLIFLNFDQYIATPINPGKYNHWNLECNIEENKLGIGLLARYITDKRGFVKNPFFKSLRPIDNKPFFFSVGDLVGGNQNYYDFSFLLTKRLFVINKKHRCDLGIGLQKRTGYLRYFVEYMGGGWEAATDDVQLDKHGLISRLGYTYLIDKHFSISTNVEYSRFKMQPAEFWDFNILGGVRF
jgi:hypothetical protein